LIVVALLWLGEDPWLVVAAVAAAGVAGLVAPRVWLAWALPAVLTAGLVVYGVVEVATWEDHNRGEAATFLLLNVAISLAAWFSAGVGVVLRAARIAR
jgi:hypothetical protein